MFVLRRTHEAACRDLRQQRREAQRARDSARKEVEKLRAEAAELRGQVLALQAHIDITLKKLVPGPG